MNEPGGELTTSTNFSLGDLAGKAAIVLGMIKFSHTIFALPFAMLSMILAADGLPPFGTMFWIIAACVFARSAAMAFNRLHDEPYDRLNPRTQGWALPAGLLTRKFVGGFVFINAAGLVFSAWMLNGLAFWLSPVALLVVLGYSVTKRYTKFAHFFLGLALAIAPVGAWIAVRGEFALTPILLAGAVLCWVAGFDIIYSCQDAEVDRRLGLHSLPSRIGKPRALAVSAACHAAAIVIFFLVWMASGTLGGFYLFTLMIAACLLAYEQSIISPDDLSKLNQAFFTVNGFVSICLFLGGWLDLTLQ